MDMKTERLILKSTNLEDVEAIVEYYRRNQNFLVDYEPAREAFYYTKAYQKMIVQASIDAGLVGSELRYWMALKEEPSKIIGTFAFTNIIMGPFKSCFLGYKGDVDYLRMGYTYEALQAGIEMVFDAYGLHRIEANIMPRNKPSLALVEKLGFYEEGIAVKYLQINGLWEDHVHMVLRNKSME